MDTNINHCSACRNVCPSGPHSDPTCTLGKCGFKCETGFGDCDKVPTTGCEVDLNTSTDNCLVCGNICPTGPNADPTCDHGTCGLNCKTGYKDCDALSPGCETNVLNGDVNNCSDCGVKCPSGADLPHAQPTCTNGVCGLICDDTYQDCDGILSNGCERKVEGGRDSCTACGNFCPPRGNSDVTCINQKCVYTCRDGFGDCDGNMENGCEAVFATDGLNCGKCGTPCLSGSHSSTSCSKGMCDIKCEAGFANCDSDQSNGCEIELGSVEHCTDCTQCPDPEITRQQAVCTKDGCGFSCNSPFTNCPSSKTDTCEINLDTDPKNCGACGAVCPSQNGKASCDKGVCSIECDSGFLNCGDPKDGCSTSIYTDPLNCNGCNKACESQNGDPTCSAGECSLMCDDGYGNCKFGANDGCETNLLTDPSNCGKCEAQCSDANSVPGTVACVGGNCLSTCTIGWGDCNAPSRDGCETNLLEDLKHCGDCKKECPTPINAQATCKNGACGFVCKDGSSDILSDPQNCGECGRICPSRTHASTTCNAGVCGFACDKGWFDCLQATNDGCETPENAINCGRCGVACDSKPNTDITCANGNCQYKCKEGFGDCNHNMLLDGFETDLSKTKEHCGTCDQGCTNQHGETECKGSKCEPKCDSGWGNCDENLFNGCETNTMDTTAHCGGCKKECKNAHGTTSCASGICAPFCSSGWGDCDEDLSNGCETAFGTIAGTVEPE